MTTVAERPARGSTRDKILQLVAETQVQAGASVRTLERLTQEMRDQFEAMAQLTKELEEDERHA